MPQTIRLAALSLSLLLLGAGEVSVAGQPATGRLHVKVELEGSAREDFPNGIEWAALSTKRSMSLDLAMWMPEVGGGPLLTLGGVDPRNPSLPPGMAAIASAVEACGEDQACIAKTMMGIGKQLAADENALGSMEVDNTRYENWVADANGPCATGHASVVDLGDGNAISPPSPARRYHFERRGEASILSEGPGTESQDSLCPSMLSIDTKLGVASLRLPAAGILIPVALSGDAFTSEKRVQFIEGVHRIELFDQPAVAGTKTWGGETVLTDVGSVSHNSGQVVVPVKTRITWEFVRD